MTRRETMDALLGLEKKGLIKLNWQPGGDGVIATLTEKGEEVGYFMEKHPDWDQPKKKKWWEVWK